MIQKHYKKIEKENVLVWKPAVNFNVIDQNSTFFEHKSVFNKFNNWMCERIACKEIYLNIIWRKVRN